MMQISAMLIAQVSFLVDREIATRKAFQHDEKRIGAVQYFVPSLSIRSRRF